MRIIAGQFKGKKINAVEGLTARPTTDYYRELIFSVLYDLDITMDKVLDLFAGSGALGLEALSRGANHVDFVEASRKSGKTILNNFSLLDCNSKCKLILKKAESFLSDCKNNYDLILIDPPYDKGFLNKISLYILKNDIISQEGVIVFEHSIKEKLNQDLLPFVFKIKQGGQTQISFISKNQKYFNKE